MQKYRSMAELKEEAKALEVEVKSDYEILSDLFTKYQQRDISSDAKLVILDDLEYYLHQVIGAASASNVWSFVIICLRHAVLMRCAESCFTRNAKMR